MGILVWLAGSTLAFVVARFLDFGRFHAAAELLIATTSGLTAGALATLLDFGGWGEPDLRAFLFCAIVASFSIALTRLALIALRWPRERRSSQQNR